MSLHRRLAKVEEAFAGLWPGEGATSAVAGLEWDELLRRVEAALDPADADLVQRILEFEKQAQATPARNLPTGEPDLGADGQQLHENHYFFTWLIGLYRGWFSLPERIPRIILESFCRRYGSVSRRCESCRTGFGNAVRIPVCPVCGSDDVRNEKLSGPPWPVEWTPLPRGH